MLDKLDLKAQKVESDSMKKGALKTLGVTLLGTALGGFGIALGSAYLALVLSNAQQDREKVVRATACSYIKELLELTKLI